MPPLNPPISGAALPGTSGVTALRGLSPLSPAASNTLQSVTQGQRASGGELGKDAFLKLLLAQLRNQDPLRPMEDREFIAQLAQFNSLEQMQQVNDRLQDMLAIQSLSQASSLIGQQVLTKVLDADGQVVSGAVQAITMLDGAPQLLVGPQQVPVSLADVVAVRQPPAQPAPVAPTPSELAAALAAAVPSASEVASELAAVVPSASDLAEALAEAVPSASELAEALAEAVPSASEVASELVEAMPSANQVASELAAVVPSASDIAAALAAAGVLTSDEATEPVQPVTPQSGGTGDQPQSGSTDGGVGATPPPAEPSSSEVAGEPPAASTSGTGAADAVPSASTTEGDGLEAQP